jgi:predicted O-methyltransferase YrrM
MTIAGYARAALGPRDPALDGILKDSLLNHRMPTIQIDDNTGRLLQMLVMLKQPKIVIEIGTLFGYSAVHIARGLPPGGRLTTLEIDKSAAKLAGDNLLKAGVSNRVDIVVGDALSYLERVAPGTVGMIFIDGDKKSYPEYLKHSIALLEPGGLIVADDAFAAGDYSKESAAQPPNQAAMSIRTYVSAVGRSQRLFSAFAGTDSGLLISLKV